MSKAQVLSAMGDIDETQGKYAQALESYQEGLKLVEVAPAAASFKEGTAADLKLGIGNVLVAENRLAQAITTYQEAFQLADKVGDQVGAAYALWKQSKIALTQQDYRQALALAEKAVSAAEKANKFTYICRILVTTAQIHRQLGQPEQARQALARAIDLIEQLRTQVAGGGVDLQRSFEATVAPFHAMIDLQVDQRRS